MTWDGVERRQPTPFEKEVVAFMSRIEEHIKVTETNQVARCNSHAADIRSLDARSTIIEQAIQLDPDGKTIGQRTATLEHALTYLLGGSATILALCSFAFAIYQLLEGR